MVKIIKADPWGRVMTGKETNEFLQGEPFLMRIGIIDSDGYPLVHPVWFVYENEKFLLTSDRNTTKVKTLKKKNKVYFVIDTVTKETGPCGVRGRGEAKIVDDAEYALEVIRKHLLRYLGSLKGPLAKQLLDAAKTDTVVIEVYPKFLGTWRYR